MLRFSSVRHNLLLVVLISAPWVQVLGHDRGSNRHAAPIWLSFQCSADLSTYRAWATGYGTHLGHFTAEGQIDSVDFNPAADRVTINGRITTVTANGDHLFLSFTSITRISTGRGIDVITFTGGTGRYAGASGYALLGCTVTEDPASPILQCECSGPGVLFLARR